MRRDGAAYGFRRHRDSGSCRGALAVLAACMQYDAARMRHALAKPARAYYGTAFRRRTACGAHAYGFAAHAA